MLRGMVLHNFVNFKERSEIVFSKTGNGPSIFVGASSTGKTVVLELIRRCMDDEKNTSLTNRCNPDEDAFVFCEYSIKHDGYGPTVITGIQVEGKHKNIQGRPSTGGNDKAKGDETKADNDGQKRKLEDDQDIAIEKDESDNNSEDLAEDITEFRKTVIFLREGCTHLIIETFSENGDGSVAHNYRDCEMIIPGEDKFYELMREDKQTNETYHLIVGTRHFDDFVEKNLSQFKGKKIRKIEYPPFWKNMQEQFVGVLAMRGISPIQWTKNKFMFDLYKWINYQKAEVNAEIIKDLFESPEVDHDREERIFDFLTSGKKFRFVKNVLCVVLVEHDNRTIPLLKIPGGILEAKQFSLLMAHKGLKTICLEEPDRSMHPQMIERMKEVLHFESRNKTIIVATHSPYLIDSTSLRNTFFFTMEKNITTVVNIYDTLKRNDYLKLFGTTDLKTILFSSVVLFVEGITDKIVLEAIFRKFKQRSVSFADSFPILRYEICSLGGKGSAKKIQDFCNKLNMKYCMVMDRDLMITTKNEKVQRVWKDFKSETEARDCCISDFFKTDFDEFSSHLAKEENLFIWKHGELEDYILGDVGKRHKICNALDPGFEKKWPENESNKVANTKDESIQKVDKTKKGKSEDEKKECMYKDMKKTVKDSLLDAISRDTLDELADMIMDYPETHRLLSFLTEID